MRQLGTGRARKRAQIAWTLVCILSLADKTVGESSTTASMTSSPPGTRVTPGITPTTTESPPGLGNTAAGSQGETEATVSTSQTVEKTTHDLPPALTTNASWPPSYTSPSPTQQPQDESTASTLPISTAEATDKVNASHTDQPTLSDQPTLTNPPSPTMSSGSDIATKSVHVECQSIKSIGANVEVICLEHNESKSCESFREEKGTELANLLCESPSSSPAENQRCHLRLSTSEVNPRCVLLILAGNEDDAKKILDIVQRNTSSLQQLGIQQYKREKVSEHQDRSRKTLIALLTCGLLLAAIIMAGFFLSNRQSWSPGRQRLGEDPYYTDDSPGNTVLPVASHDQSELQEKPNLNGGAQENGTGQPVSAAATNGRSTRQHVVADTEL